jgi:hypothetical protein
MRYAATPFWVLAVGTIFFAASLVVAHPGGHPDDTSAPVGPTHIAADDDVESIDDGCGAVDAVATDHVRITVTDGVRTITADGIPDHVTGQFPNRNNPNTIRAQRYTFKMPVAPQKNERPTDVGGWLYGVALNGVPFDPGTAEYWRGTAGIWRYDALSGKINLGLDDSHAHVQPTGAYHYHGLPTGLIKKHSEGTKAQMTLIGYAADGFPIYNQYGHDRADDAASPVRVLRSSYKLKNEIRPGGGNVGPGGKCDGTFVEDFAYVAGSGDLDECNGREGVTPEYPEGTYYYAVTEEFPFISRWFRGTPDESFRHHAAGGQRGPGGPPGPRPGGMRPGTNGGFGPQGPAVSRRQSGPPPGAPN